MLAVVGVIPHPPQQLFPSACQLTGAGRHGASVSDHPGTQVMAFLGSCPIRTLAYRRLHFSAEATVLGSLMMGMIKALVSHLSQVM